MITFQPKCGTEISHACQKAGELANKSNSPVTFDFNGVTVVVQPGEPPADAVARWHAAFEQNAEAYRNSPKGKAMAAYQEARERQCQRETDVLIARLPKVVHDLSALIRWCVALSKSADHIGVHWDRAAVADTIEAAGWKNGAHVGRPKEYFADRTVMGEYIVGQALSCLRNGMAPHPIVETFAKDGGFLS